MPHTSSTPTWAKVLSARGGDAVLNAIRSDPVEFVQTLLTEPNGTPAKPHPAQVEILHGIRPRTVVRAGRRFGKSKVMGWRGTWHAVTHANHQVYIIGPTLDQARIIFNEVARHFRRPPLSLLVEGKVKDYPFPHIRLSNGSEIHGRGANSPNYIRGHEAHLIIDDEASFFKEGVIGQVIEPMMLTTVSQPDAAQIDVSTPFGRGEFYEAEQYARQVMAAGGSDAVAFHFTSYDNPYADRKYLARILERNGEDSLLWQTEYLAEFVDDDLAVFPWADIRWAYENYPYTDPLKLQAPEFPIPPIPGHRYVQGVDLANTRDYFVSIILDATDPYRLVLVKMDRYQRRGYAAYKESVRANYREYNHARTLIDSTTLAEAVVEDLSDIGAEGYKFTSQSKYELIQDLVRLYAEHRLLIPYHRDILDEHRYYAYEILPSKRLRMEAGRGHDDIVTALALAAHLGAVVPSLGFFRPILTIPPKLIVPRGYDPCAALFTED
jgi:hypothetical protein